MAPVICFGQQPCGFFPRRFLVAKITAARRLQNEIGGEIVFFWHDSDHDPRETKTILRHRKNDRELPLNFTFENRIQRKYSPQYAKRVPADWHAKTLAQLPPFVAPELVDAFRDTPCTDVSAFCLEMYRKLGLLEGIRIVRSGDPEVRRAACAVEDFYVDVPYEGEIVRARLAEGSFTLHEGGSSFIRWPATEFERGQVSPARDTRLRWMQSVVHCTHYVAGAGEQQYLDPAQAPGVSFVPRDAVDRHEEAWTGGDIPSTVR
jgi:hypothetical protein